MAINQRETYVYHVGETASPFRCDLRQSDGSKMTDVASATFTLTNADTDEKLIDAGVCQSVTDGILLYYPEVGELSVACRFEAQFIATLSGGAVLPTQRFDGEIQANL